MNTLGYCARCSHSSRILSLRRNVNICNAFSSTSSSPQVQESPLIEEKPYFYYELIHKSSKSKARVGRIHTPHGIIDTPCFVPVATNGTMKHLDNVTIEQEGIDVQMLFMNTYHLVVQPGAEHVSKLGGLHKFIGRKQPIITDSGGFQVFSLLYGNQQNDELKGKSVKKNQPSTVLKINEDGVTFRSYRDGKIVHLGPESSIQYQKKLGADMIVSFDELPPYKMESEKLSQSLERTHRWEIRSLREHQRNKNQQAMYAVLHGGVDRTLRARSIETLCAEPFEGLAIGGSLGRHRAEMMDLLHFMAPRLPTDRPIHLLGIGDPPSIEQAIPLGLDTFDSSFVSRAGRHGTLFSRQGDIKLRAAKYATDLSPIDPQCKCSTCARYSMAYLHHLLKANEPVFAQLGTIHNLRFMMDYMKSIREKILRDEI